jgi:hypothetical protein
LKAADTPTLHLWEPTVLPGKMAEPVYFTGGNNHLRVNCFGHMEPIKYVIKNK